MTGAARVVAVRTCLDAASRIIEGQEAREAGGVEVPPEDGVVSNDLVGVLGPEALSVLLVSPQQVKTMSRARDHELVPVARYKGLSLSFPWKYGTSVVLPQPKEAKHRADFPFRTVWAVLPGGGVIPVQQCCAWSNVKNHRVGKEQ